jgi:hypothetical protein
MWSLNLNLSCIVPGQFTVFLAGTNLLLYDLKEDAINKFGIKS